MADRGRTFCLIGAKDVNGDDNVVWVANGMPLSPTPTLHGTHDCYMINNGVIGYYTCVNGVGGWICQKPLC